MVVQTSAAIINKEEALVRGRVPRGGHSQSETVEEALLNLKEATELYLEEFPLAEAGRPLLTTFEATYA